MEKIMIQQAWLLRVILGVALLFGNEILLWQDPPLRTLPEWGVLMVGYIAIGAIVLDFAVRYRVNDMYLAMLMICIGALLIGVLLNPTLLLADFPRHLITRVIGASGFLSIEMWGLVLVLMGGHIRRYRRLLMGYAVVIGFNWGVWAHYAVLLTNWSTTSATIAEMAFFGGICLVFIGGGMLVYIRRHRPDFTPRGLQMSLVTWCMVGIALTMIFMLRAIENIYHGEELLVTGILVVICWLGLWSQRPEKGKMLLDAHFPPIQIPPLWGMAMVVLFGVMAGLGYALPLIPIADIGQLYVLELAFAGIGALWLPLVATVLAVRAIERQSRKLDIL